MSTTELQLKVTSEQIVDCRDRALKLFAEAEQLVIEAEKLATSAMGRNFSIRHCHTAIGRRDFGKDLRKEIDKGVWRHVLLTTGLGDQFDSKHRQEFENTLERGEVPAVTVENIVATSLTLASRAGDMYAESVEHLFKHLHFRFKSHDGFGFGARIIFEGAIDLYGFGLHTQQLIHDLERVVYLADGVAPPERYGGLAGMIRAKATSFTREAGEVSDKYFRAKWYKNGNLHIWLLRDDLREKMNLTLADGSLGHNGEAA